MKKILFLAILLITAMVSTKTIYAENLSVISPFGWRAHPVTGEYQFHHGVDLGYDYGASIAAIFDGEVVKCGDLADGYGKQVLIYHSEIDAYTRYAHCSELYVTNGQKVSKGDIIAAVGSNGDSVEPHLHLEYIINSGGAYVYVDPLILW